MIFLLCMLGPKEVSQWVTIITENLTVVHLVGFPPWDNPLVCVHKFVTEYYIQSK